MSIDSLLHGMALTEGTGAIVAGIGVFISVMALGQALVPHDPMAARLRNHRKRREMLRAQIVSGNKAEDRRRASVGILKRLLDRMKLLRGEEASKTSDLLAQAGWRSRDALVVFFVLLTLDPSASALNKLLGALTGGCIGGLIPTFGLKLAVRRRKARLRKQLPDGLDLMVICAEAGLSLDAALTRVGREIGYSSPELADEIGLTAIELSFLPNRRQALMNLAKRTDLPSIRGVTNTLIQTERYGTPLAHSLRVLSAEFRDERMMKAEEKAHKLPAVLTVPMILFILPTLFMVMLGPAILQVIDTWGK